MLTDSFDTVIKNGLVVLPETGLHTDIGIQDGRVSKLGQISLDTKGPFEVIDAANKVVMPGMIDIHVHLNDPGTNWEGFRTGSMALAAGERSYPAQEVQAPIMDHGEKWGSINESEKHNKSLSPVHKH